MNTHRFEPRRLALVAMFCAALLATAFGQPSPSSAQVPGPFAVVKDFGGMPYEGSSLFTGGSSSFSGAVVTGSIAFFQAYTPDAGSEIWRSDGSESGTFLLKDICPGAGDQFPAPQLVEMGTKVYFDANDCATGKELWTSDGTSAGTKRVKDINPGAYSSGPEHFFVVSGHTLFFSAYDGTTTKIWKSDGTDAGTVPTGVSGTPIFALGNGLFFTSYTGNTCTMKRLDATSSAVSDVAPLCPSGIYGGGEGVSIAVGAALAYFTAGDTSTGTEVWRSDGTAAGTFLLKDIKPGAASSSPSNFVIGPLGQLFFSASDGTNGAELWMSDGTTANTSMVKDINPGSGGSGPIRMAVWNNIVFFTAYDGTQTELWRSDGSAANTYMVKDLTPTAGVSSNPDFLTPANNALFFVATDGTHPGSLFKTDGTANGTVLVKSLSGYNGVYAPVALGGAGIIFLGDDGVHGGEPWFSDGSEAGTRMIKDIAGPENGSSQPTSLTPVNGQLLYVGNNVSGTPGDRYAIYRSDGSVTGTLPLATSNAPPPFYAADRGPAAFDGALYFAAYTSSGTNGFELWRSDGTITGTALFADINPGMNSSDPRWLTPSGQTLFFAANNSNNGDELWKTNGTAETTMLVKDIAPGSNGSFPAYLTADGAGGVYFVANDGTTGAELWHSDGSESGTRVLLDIAPGSTGSNPENLTLAGTNLFFTAQDATAGRELRVTNGTPEGTRRVRDITTGTAGTGFAPYQQPFTVIGDRVFFVATTDLFGAELWSSDGTENGTAIVKDVYPGTGSSDVEELTALNGALYFAATGGDGTRTLWRSDGTTAGTATVASGPNAPVNPKAFSVIDGLLYFSAADQSAAAGRELWVSDGTAGGTRMLQDLNPGPTSSNPTGIVKSGERIYLSAYKPGEGVELWSATIPTTPTPTPLPGEPTPTPPASNEHRTYLPLTQR